MTRAGRWVLSMLLWTWGGAAYFLLEVVYKSIREEPERISWTMLVLAALLCVPIERAGAELPWECPLPLQALICAALVTVTELWDAGTGTAQPFTTAETYTVNFGD